MGQVVGIDLTLVPYLFTLHKIPLSEQKFLLDKLTLISRVMVRLFNEKAKQKRD